MTTYQKIFRLQRIVTEERLVALTAAELRRISPLTSGQLAARMLLDPERVLRILKSTNRFVRVGVNGSDLWALAASPEEAPHVA